VRRPMSLWSVMASITAMVTIASMGVAGALVYLTTILHRTTTLAAAAVESVSIAEGARINLLLHERAMDPIVRLNLESRLLQRLMDARQYASTDEEGRILSEAESLVLAYIEASRGGAPDVAARQQAAYSRLEALVAINLHQAEDAQREAARWDSVGTRLGLWMSAFLLLGSAALLIWLRNSAIRPILLFARAMERFGAGDLLARSEERGPAEVRDMIRRFNGMASAIMEQRQARIAFLGGVAHDLRNPLAALRNTLNLLVSDRPLPPEQRHAVAERIGRQIRRMERMLGDFLDAARVEAGHLELKFRTHDLRQLVESAVEMSDGTEAGQRLHVSLPLEPLPLVCDPLRIEQVLSNLISNAVKYSPVGSAVEISAAREGSRLILRVADQGAGMTEAEKARIFEPFARVGKLRETVPGMGLGLFVVRRIIEAHGGAIEVHTSPGKGTVFAVTLPVERVEPAARRSEEGPDAQVESAGFGA
jgi:two-component system, OmpR family, sensor histidine kinase MtrB